MAKLKVHGLSMLFFLLILSGLTTVRPYAEEPTTMDAQCREEVIES